MTNVEKLQVLAVLAVGKALVTGVDIVRVTNDDGDVVQKVVLDIEGLPDTIFLTVPEALKAFGVLAKGVLTDDHMQLIALFSTEMSWSKSRICEVGTTYSPWIKDDLSEDFTPEQEDFVDLHGVTFKFTKPDSMLLSMLKVANSATDGVLYDREAERAGRTEKRAALRRVNAEEVVATKEVVTEGIATDAISEKGEK